MKSLLKIAIGAAALTAATFASANTALWLSTTQNLGDGIIIEDNDANDSNSAVGIVTYIGSLGVWNLNVSTGLVVQGGVSPEIDFNSLNHSTGAGDLFMAFGTTDVGPSSSANMTAGIGGTTDGTVEFYATTGNNSGPFNWDLPWLYQTFGNNTNNNPFSGEQSMSLSADADSYGVYNLTAWVYVHHQTGGNTSFDAAVTVPDGGVTAALLGLGLLGLGVASRRVKRA